MNLLLLDHTELTPEGHVRLVDGRRRHLINVLKVQPEQTVRIGLIDGPLGVGRVVAMDREAVDLACTFEKETPPRPRIDLLLALPRPKVLQRLLAQVAALGVGRLMLTNAERVERNYFDTHVLSPAVYGPLLVEGLQQARDTRVPIVSVHRQFRLLVEDDLDTLSPSTRRIVADPSAASSITDALADLADRVLLAVGPEGGWNRFELELLAARRFVRVGMGTRTLRSDTACVGLLTVAHEVLRCGSPET